MCVVLQLTVVLVSALLTVIAQHAALPSAVSLSTAAIPPAGPIPASLGGLPVKKYYLQ
jgi:hypothetical protein